MHGADGLRSGPRVLPLHNELLLLLPVLLLMRDLAAKQRKVQAPWMPHLVRADPIQRDVPHQQSRQARQVHLLPRLFSRNHTRAGINPLWLLPRCPRPVAPDHGEGCRARAEACDERKEVKAH